MYFVISAIQDHKYHYSMEQNGLDRMIAISNKRQYGKTQHRSIRRVLQESDQS